MYVVHQYQDLSGLYSCLLTAFADTLVSEDVYIDSIRTALNETLDEWTQHNLVFA
jgi:hypothetical protein